MGSGGSRPKGRQAAYPLPECTPPKPNPRQCAGGVSWSTPPNCAERERAGGCPKMPGDDAGILPDTQHRPGTKTTRPGTMHRPITEYSQSTTRPNTEYVLAFNFGAERSTPPISDRSAASVARNSEKLAVCDRDFLPPPMSDRSASDDEAVSTSKHFETMDSNQHFPPAPFHGQTLIEDDGASSTTCGASVQGLGSQLSSRGTTPLAASESASRPGMRGVDSRPRDKGRRHITCSTAGGGRNRDLV